MVNSDSRSERIAITWKSCAKVSTVNTIVCQLAEPWRQRPPLREDRKPADQQADPDDVVAEPAGEEALARRARRPLHDAVLRRLDREREPRQAVGDQVDPEDLDRQQRERQAEQRRDQQTSTISPELPVSTKRMNLRMLS